MTIHLLPERIHKLLCVDPVTGCWLFVGKWTTGNGYAKTYWQGAHRVLHRVVWTILRGPICPGFVLDHKKECRNRLCSNPDHLDPVTSDVNTARGNGVLTQFKPRAQYEARTS